MQGAEREESGARQDADLRKRFLKRRRRSLYNMLRCLSRLYDTSATYGFTARWRSARQPFYDLSYPRSSSAAPHPRSLRTHLRLSSICSLKPVTTSSLSASPHAPYPLHGFSASQNRPAVASHAHAYRQDCYRPRICVCRTSTRVCALKRPDHVCQADFEKHAAGILGPCDDGTATYASFNYKTYTALVCSTWKSLRCPAGVAAEAITGSPHGW